MKDEFHTIYSACYSFHISEVALDKVDFIQIMLNVFHLASEEVIKDTHCMSFLHQPVYDV